MEFSLKSLAIVKNVRTEPIDDHWSSIHSTIEVLGENAEECLRGLESFSHIEIVFVFHKAKDEQIVLSGHPRGNPNYPSVGIFAQRKKDRPNRLGLSICEILKIENRYIYVKGLDAIDGTPILDIKPVFPQLLPQGEIRNPEWVASLMEHYWE
ncbi:transcriptional regulator [Leptospira ryugenii]|uniref:Transcriptional regulator n=1 Tax=Leptospira ryugenii TaxID=1917863 RepID=A0A2P2DV82_9LEPT|nr:tRNA (N6-threonylcarbamoyladenosine(37)-N6)-methyltransferase TrmO [Leptospira ryugenii]GBF48549.1 transcriptional regulator [Leptospira ryugenii]